MNTGVASADSDAMQASQKGSGNFLAIEAAGNVLKGYAVSSGGLPTGTTWNLAPTAPNGNDESSLSADGLAVATNRSATGVADKLYLQFLTSTVRASGSSKFLISFTNIEATDITSALANGNRFIVFVVVSASNKLFLQRVDSLGNKIGSAIVLNTPPGRDQDDQNVAIDPLGRFVLFTINGINFGCSGHDILVYQALDATGHVSGAIKPIAKCGLVADDIVGVDLLKN